MILIATVCALFGLGGAVLRKAWVNNKVTEISVAKAKHQEETTCNTADDSNDDDDFTVASYQYSKCGYD